ncbi:MAG: cofactor-independent phosphoglycerate mutase [Candidatus Cloacimonadaceae bacterium]|nr:cofactor-independent phosphoglycerate mutase [Candidatus Cloacimonadaceae bacterium]
MKTIIILGDGMADLPIAELGGKTPLMAARKPNIDRLASLGRCGMYKTVPDDMPPGSEVANLAVMGYDVRAVYQGRGVLEGAAMGVDIQPGDLAMRCNLICLEDNKIKNHSAGHIPTEDGRELINALNEEFGTDRISFHPGVSYRHLLVIKGGNNSLKLTPPHDVPGTPWKDVLPEATAPEGKETADLLTDLIIRSQAFLAKHPVNLRRIAAGKDPGNCVWFWSAGMKPDMKTFMELYGKTGAVISAVDLLHGIGVYAGFQVIHVPGATGLWDTNYEGKVAAALNALKEVDLVYLHIEAADEAGHEGDFLLKTRCIEDLDSRVVAPIMAATIDQGDAIRIALLPDHPTPCGLRTHTHDPIPFIIYKPGNAPDSVSSYDEEACQAGSYGMFHGTDFMKELLG